MGAKLTDLVVAGGTGDANDVSAVISAAAPLPAQVLNLFDRKGARIVACRAGVTDFETGLKGVVPRGWEGLGRTWDNVPGTYLDTIKRVVIATIGVAGGRQVTPRGPTTHGAFSLVVHESMHGYDYLGNHKVLQNANFVAARTADWGALGSYEKQDGLAGLEETYAESASRYFGGDPTLGANWPNLRAFWQAAWLEAVEGPPVELPPAESRGPVGTARIDERRTIYLDLRAEGPGGAIGHAALEFTVDDPVHDRLARHLARQGEGVDGEALFYPLAD